MFEDCLKVRTLLEWCLASLPHTNLHDMAFVVLTVKVHLIIVESILFLDTACQVFLGERSPSSLHLCALDGTLPTSPIWSMWPSSQPTGSSYCLRHSGWFRDIGNDWILVIRSQACWKRDSWWTRSRDHVDPEILQSFYTMWRLRMKLTCSRTELTAQEKLRLFMSQNLEKLKYWLLLEFSRFTWKKKLKII